MRTSDVYRNKITTLFSVFNTSVTTLRTSKSRKLVSAVSLSESLVKPTYSYQSLPSQTVARYSVITPTRRLLPVEMVTMIHSSNVSPKVSLQILF